jgi:hypothetical protein
MESRTGRGAFHGQPKQARGRPTIAPPVARELYDDIEARQASAAGSLRAFAGPDVEDPQFIELVGKLSIKSPDFRRLWSRHDVRPMHGALPRIGIRHPQLGPIDLYHQKLEIPYTDGQILGLLYAEPGSKSEQAVAMLAATMDEPHAAPSPDEPVRHPQSPAGRADRGRPREHKKSARPPKASRFIPIARPSSRLGPKDRAYSLAGITLNYFPSGG